MDIKKRIGQLLMIGISSKSLLKEEKKLVEDLNIGGLILFGRNYEYLEQLIDLVNDINSAKLSHPPFIGVDQEGGNVIRFGKPFTQFPGNYCLGKYYENTGSLDVVSEYARLTARELKISGLNLCFAPVVDILTNPKNEIIGGRAFSSKTETVAELGARVVKIFREEEILGCAKHFPGHGNTVLDSHKTLPRVKHDLDCIRKRELIPFGRAITEGVPFIMTSHILYESIDDKYPATVSRKILSDVLRGEMGYEKIIISDDFEMKGLSDYFRIEEASRKALEAGVDIILICKSHKRVLESYESLIKQVEKSSKFRERVWESLLRVEKIKSDYNLRATLKNPDLAKNEFDTDKADKLVSRIKSCS